MSFFYEYRAHRFNGKAKKTVEQANEIITEMAEQGYTLTLRQLYYQFVRRNCIPNNEKEYKRLGRLVTQARESGVMDWLAIEDRGRTSYNFPCEEDLANVVKGIKEELIYDLWARQDTYIEVWVEKQALESVIARPCSRLMVPYMACKGYLSASEAWRAGMRFQDAIARDKHPLLIHLADHDPSGLNMTEDNRDRVSMFAESLDVEVSRIALNMDQVDQYKPPPNPAKESDSRSVGYVKRFGKHSWELDALEPGVIDALIEDKIRDYIDTDAWEAVLKEQAKARKPLAALSNNWDKVEEFLKKEKLIK